MSMSFGTYFGDPVIILTEFCNITKLLKCNLKLLNCVSTFTDGSDLKKNICPGTARNEITQSEHKSH